MISQDKIEKIFQIFSSADPKPKTELEYSNNFTLTIAVILSAQATDISVNKATKKMNGSICKTNKTSLAQLIPAIQILD